MNIHNKKRHIIAGLLLTISIIGCSSPEQRLAKFLQEGQDYLAEEEYTKARLQFRNAYEMDDQNIEALLGLIEIAEYDRDFRRMFGLLKTLVRLDPENIEALTKMGNIYLLASDEAAAQDTVDKALAIDPQNPGALALQASILYKLGDTQTAIDLARKVLALNPSNQDALALIVSEKGKRGDFEGALAELDAGLAKTPENPLLNLLRIELLNTMGRTDEVDGAFRKLISFYPDDPSFYQSYAQYLIREDRPDAARENLLKIIELSPDDLEGHLRLVRQDFREGGVEAAKATFLEQLNVYPDNTDLKFAYAQFLTQEKDVEDAEVIYKDFAKRGKNDADKNRGKVLLAGLYITGDRREEGEDLLDEVLESDPGNTLALAKRAGLKIQDELYDEAIIDLRNSLSSDPNNADSLILFGLAFEKKGDIPFAELQLTRAFEVDPKSARIANAFAKFLIKIGKPQRADNILLQNLRYNSTNIEGIKLLATARLAYQNWTGATEAARLLEEQLGSNDPTVDRILGTASVGLQDYSEAISRLSKANEQAPLQSQALSTLISAYIEEGRISEAEELLARMLANDPNNYDAHILQAQVAFAQEKGPEGEAALNEAILTNPEKSRAYELLYRYYLFADRRPDAFALIYGGLERYPENYLLKFLEADILLNEKRYEDALAVYENLNRRRPEDRFVANNYVSLLTDLKADPVSSAKALEVAKTIRDIDSPDYQDTLGWAYYRAGDLQNARVILKRVVEEKPDTPIFLYHLGSVYFALEEYDRARPLLERAIQLGGENFRYAPQVTTMLNKPL